MIEGPDDHALARDIIEVHGTQAVIIARDKDVLMATGELDRLIAALVRHCDRAMIPGRRRGRLVWGVGCQA
jgi:hypothetical protein